MKKALFVVTLLLFWASVAFGQRDGVATFSATDSYEFDSINLSTLVPTFKFPVLSKGAGAMPGSIVMAATQNCHTGIVAHTFVCGAGQTNAAIPTTILQEMLTQMTVGYSSVNNSGCITFTIFSLLGVDGVTSYKLPSTNLYSPSTCGSQSATITTNDGTGYTVTISSSTGAPEITSLYNSSGWSASYPNGTSSTVTDPFSNTINLSGTTFTNNGVFTDSLGAITDFNGSTYAYQYTDANGSTQDITFTNGTSVNYFPLNACDNTHGSGTMTPVTSINYPDGTSIALGWETHGTGDSGQINSITLRTGGQISYVYTNGGSCNAWYNTALTRTTPDGTWNYTLSAPSTTTTVTRLDPGKNKTVWVLGGGTLSAGNPSTFIESIDRYQNTGTVASPMYTHISETLYCYNTSSNPCTNTPAYPITQRDIYEYVYTSGGTQVQMSHDEQTYDSYGNVLTDANTDSINSQTITKTIVYGTLSGGSCVALGNTHVVDHPCTITTKNGTTQLAYETFTYNTNGAPTASTEWISSTDTLTTNYTANSNGTMATKTLPNGQVITNTYGNCNNLLLTDSTTTVNSVAIDNKATWNCNGAVITDTTDANSNEDDYAYDSMNRISSYTDRLENVTSYAYGTPTMDHVKVTDPLSVVSYVYNDGLGRPTNKQICQTTGCSNLDTSSKSYAWNGTNFETKTYVPCVQTVLNTACTTVALTSDVNPIAGPTLSTDANSGTLTYAVNSKDFSVTAGPAPSQENTKVLQTEIDGFGRTTSTCVLTSTGYNGRVSCGQTMGNNGTLTSNTYSFDATTGAPKVVTTRGSQTHTTITDSIGRPTTITTPEAGTFTYLYDADSSSDVCGNSRSFLAGVLAKRTDNASGYLCYDYDGLGRVTAIGTSAQSSSPATRFAYDAAGKVGGCNTAFTAPTGWAASNIVGRVVEAETDATSATCTLGTDEWFAYDKDGRITDMWQCDTLSSCPTYIHTSVVYDADGTVTSLAGIPSVSTITYGVDGEDRWNSAKVGTNTIVPTSGVTYDAASRATQVNLWSGTDNDTYSFDNVGNMTQYQFFVGSANNKGVLTWNSIGSLNKLTITDGLNTNNTQTCTFGTASPAVEGYDDVGRLLSDNCGTVWAQTYSYDQYDNITKSGSSAWNPGYSSTNNEFQNGATYDSNGNVTKDATGGNTYTWNLYQKMASENSVNATYDAFGRMITYSTYEILYSPIGRLGTLSSGSPFGMTIPAPGGMGMIDARASSTNYYYHNDWIGSSRTASSSSGLTWSKSFSPYGDVYNSSGTNDHYAGIDGFTFSGITYSAPNRELAYNATRWLSPDPCLGCSGPWSRYAYPTDPNTQTDPSGLGDDLCAGCVVWNGMTIKPGGCAFTPKDSFCNSGEAVQSQEVNQEGTEIPRPGAASPDTFLTISGSIRTAGTFSPFLITQRYMASTQQINRFRQMITEQGIMLDDPEPNRYWVANRAAELEMRGMDENFAMRHALTDYMSGLQELGGTSEAQSSAMELSNTFAEAMARELTGGRSMGFMTPDFFPTLIRGTMQRIAGPVSVVMALEQSTANEAQDTINRPKAEPPFAPPIYAPYLNNLPWPW